jgi:putative MATE family efflux protein
MKEYTEKLGYAPLGRLLISLSLPSIAAMLSTSLYNVVDTFWVARLGYEAIAALTIIFPYQILFFATAIGTGAGIGALVSRRFGERNIEATNQAAGQMFFLSVFLGAIFIIVAVLFSGDLLTAFGATPDIMEFSTQYVVIISFGAPQLIFLIMASQLIRGSGDAIKPMIINISASVINIILDPLLIFGVGPFPELGVRGAALATIIAQSCGALLTLYYLIALKTTFSIKVHHLRPNITILRDIFRVGGPSTIFDITESLAFVLFNNVLSAYGSVAIAAVGLVLRVSDLSFMPIIGVSQGLLPIVGFNFGARNFKRLWGAVKLASVGIAAFLTAATIGIESFTPGVVTIFSKDTELLALTIPAMRIMVSTMPFIGPNIMFITTFQGISKGTMALILSLVRQFILFVPLLYVLSHFLGMHGIWLSAPASDILAFIITLAFILREYVTQKRDRGISMPRDPVPPA